MSCICRNEWDLRVILRNRFARCRVFARVPKCRLFDGGAFFVPSTERRCVIATFTGGWFAMAFQALADKQIDLIGSPDTLKCALVTSAFDPAAVQDTADFFNDVTNELGAGSGYTAGGFTLDSVVFGYTAGTNTWMLDCADEVVASTTLTWRSAIIYDSTPATDATRPLILYQKGDSDTITTGGTLTISPAAAGLGTIVLS